MFTVHFAKTNLSKLLQQAEGGKHVWHQLLLTGADLLKSDHVRAVQIVLD